MMSGLKAELFTIKPVLQGTQAASVLGPGGEIRVTVVAPVAFHVDCRGCPNGEWNFRYDGTAEMKDVLAHLTAHSDTHPDGDGWMPAAAVPA